jgi:uncharacterized protein YjiS (DUF1127 family)
MRTKADCAVKTLPSPAVVQIAVPSVFGSLATHMIRFARAIQNRICVNRLTEMDDRLLNDIGLKRHDVDRALGASIGDDPSHELTRSAVANAKMRFKSGF